MHTSGTRAPGWTRQSRGAVPQSSRDGSCQRRRHLHRRMPCAQASTSYSLRTKARLAVTEQRHSATPVYGSCSRNDHYTNFVIRAECRFVSAASVRFAECTEPSNCHCLIACRGGETDLQACPCSAALVEAHQRPRRLHDGSVWHGAHAMLHGGLRAPRARC